MAKKKYDLFINKRYTDESTINYEFRKDVSYLAADFWIPLTDLTPAGWHRESAMSDMADLILVLEIHDEPSSFRKKSTGKNRSSRSKKR